MGRADPCRGHPFPPPTPLLAEVGMEKFEERAPFLDCSKARGGGTPRGGSRGWNWRERCGFRQRVRAWEGGRQGAGRSPPGGSGGRRAPHPGRGGRVGRPAPLGAGGAQPRGRRGARGGASVSANAALRAASEHSPPGGEPGSVPRARPERAPARAPRTCRPAPAPRLSRDPSPGATATDLREGAARAPGSRGPFPAGRSEEGAERGPPAPGRWPSSLASGSGGRRGAERSYPAAPATPGGVRGARTCVAGAQGARPEAQRAEGAWGAAGGPSPERGRGEARERERRAETRATPAPAPWRRRIRQFAGTTGKPPVAKGDGEAERPPLQPPRGLRRVGESLLFPFPRAWKGATTSENKDVGVEEGSVAAAPPSDLLTPDRRHPRRTVSAPLSGSPATTGRTEQAARYAPEPLHSGLPLPASPHPSPHPPRLGETK